MSNFRYDISAKYDESIEYSIDDLCEQMQFNEDIPLDDKVSGDFSYYFKSNKKSSLLKKLKDLLDFDMESICQDDPKEIFDMLKILYILFKIEKYGSPRFRSEIALKKKRVLITNILANHSFENIENAFSKKSVYSEIFNELYDDIKSQVNDAEKRFDTLDNIDFDWYHLAYMYFQEYVISANAVFHQSASQKELDRIYNYLKNVLLKKLKTATPTKLPCNDGVMKSFFNILNYHEFICYNHEKIRINNKKIHYDSISKLYINCFREYSQKRINWNTFSFMLNNIKYVNNDFKKIDMAKFENLLTDILSNIDKYSHDDSQLYIKARLFELKKTLNNLNLGRINKLLDYVIKKITNPDGTDIKPSLNEIKENFGAMKILWFVSKFKGIEKCDHTHYKYALNNIKEFSEIFLIVRDLDIENSIDFDLFIAMMQEVIEVKKYGGTIENPYYGRKHTDSYLKTSLSDFSKSSSVANLYWVTKIENRIAINYGQIKCLKRVREIENLLYKIKKIIYQYRNLNDLVDVNNFIIPLARYALMPNEQAIKYMWDFSLVLMYNISILNENYNLIILGKPKNNRVYDFFREVLYTGEENYIEIKNQIFDSICSFYADSELTGKKLFTIPIVNETSSVLSFTVDKNKNVMEYIDYKPYALTEKLKSLSLESFICNDNFES